MAREPDETRHEGTPHWAERLVRFMDDGFVIPGTRHRFGFDSVLGLLLPVAGDAAGAVGALSLFWLAIRRGVPRPVLARMAVNVGIDSLVGAIPVLGDLFDLVWKSNRRNLKLIREATGGPVTRKKRLGDYLTFAGIALLIGCAFALPIVLVALLLGSLRG